MDNFEKDKTLQKIAASLEKISVELEKLNLEGITVWGGSTMEEN